MTTNDLQMIIDLWRHNPYLKNDDTIKPLEYLVEQVEAQPTTSSQVAIIKSSNLFS